jgi:hypothetical protein
MIIVDTPHGAAVLDWRGYHKTDKEELYLRLYGSFAEGLDKKERKRCSRITGRGQHTQGGR